MYNEKQKKQNDVKREMCYASPDNESIKNHGKPVKINEYNEDAKLNRTFSEENNDTIEFYDISRFDKEGNQIMEIFYDCRNFINSYPQEYSSKDIDFYSHDGTYYESKKYDNKDRMINKVSEITETRRKGKDIEWQYRYDAKGKIKRKFITKYENNKKLIFCLDFYENSLSLKKTYYIYDNYNNIISDESWSYIVYDPMEILYPTTDYSHKVYTYDERNNRKEEIHINSDETIFW